MEDQVGRYECVIWECPAAGKDKILGMNGVANTSGCCPINSTWEEMMGRASAC